jgi:hypothetical protein
MPARASGRPAGPRPYAAGALIATALCLAACAGTLDGSALIVLPDKYSLSTCKEIIAGRTGFTAREKELSELSDKGGLIVGTAAYASELAVARAELKAIAKAHREKNCDANPNN